MQKTIYYNGPVVTMEESCPTAEAVLTEDGIIKRTGAREEIFRYRDSQTQMRDLKGMTLLPGFIDPHSHLTAVAYQLLMVNAAPSPSGECDTVERLVEVFRKRLLEDPPRDGQWLMGMGYDNSAYPDGVSPTKYDLDRVSTDIPICCIHVSGHCAVLNSKAMEELGYAGESFEIPSGGLVEYFPGTRDTTGLIGESALLSQPVQAKIKAPGPDKVLESVKKACGFYSSFGITTAQDARVNEEQYTLLTQAGVRGDINIDVVAYCAPEVAEKYLAKGRGTFTPYQNHVRLGGYKYFLDGSPQAKTAWLSRPYYKAPEGKPEDYRGFPVQEEAEVYRTMRLCLENNWQINVHCNGDEACEQMIDQYEKAKKDTGSSTDLRPVMVHAQMVREDQLDRMKEIGILPTFFLDHVYYWGDYHYESVLGPERAERISPVGSAARRGMNFTMHQDAPVVKPNALFAVHNAVNRVTRKGRVLGADQRVSVETALKGVTINGAYQIFEEHRKGSITAGKLADLVILDRNPLTVPADAIKDIRVMETIKEGVTIFRRQAI